MSITVIPREKREPGWSEQLGSGLGSGFSGMMQLAFMNMLKRQQEDMQRQRNIEQAQQMFPDAFTEIPQQYEETSMGRVPVKPTSPQIPKQYRFDMEKAKEYPGLGLDLTTGGMEYKVPSALGTMPIINITPEGKTEQIGTAPRGAKVVSTLPQQKFETEQEEKKQQLEEKSQFIRDTASDTLNTISEIEKRINYFGLFGQIPSIPGTERYIWETNINKLLSGKMIDLMTQMKQASRTGATGFGQLSEKEGQILREASTALKRGLPPQKAQEYLNSMKGLLQKVISKQQAQLPTGFSPDEWEVVNE